MNDLSKNHTARAMPALNGCAQGKYTKEWELMRRTAQDENETELKGKTGKGMRRRREEVAAGAAGREN